MAHHMVLRAPLGPSAWRLVGCSGCRFTRWVRSDEAGEAAHAAHVAEVAPAHHLGEVVAYLYHLSATLADDGRPGDALVVLEAAGNLAALAPAPRPSPPEGLSRPWRGAGGGAGPSTEPPTRKEPQQ